MHLNGADSQSKLSECINARKLGKKPDDYGVQTKLRSNEPDVGYVILISYGLRHSLCKR